MAHAGRTFRIFVSSTFTDLQEERNALQRKVFPALKKLCAEAGCQFQAIDLRWGVGEEAGLDQRTMRICLEELERCRQTSPRPNFILLLGDRYGWESRKTLMLRAIKSSRIPGRWPCWMTMIWRWALTRMNRDKLFSGGMKSGGNPVCEGKDKGVGL